MAGGAGEIEAVLPIHPILIADEKVVLSPHDAVKVDHHLQDIVKAVLQHRGDTRDKKVVLHHCLLCINLLVQVLGQ